MFWLKNILMIVGLAFAVTLVTPQLAWAQEEEEDLLEELDEYEAELDGTEEDEAGDGEDLPEIGEEDQLAVFELQRGYYISTDMGVFLTFGGASGMSNVQPYLGVNAGVDLNEYFSVQGVVSTGYASGNAISENNQPIYATGKQNYGLFNMGVQLVAALRPGQRFALEPKVGGGLTSMNPALTDPADSNADLPAVTAHVSGGLDLKYLTLLTDFTAGMSLTGYYILGPNIPAVGAAFTLRYTF
mgnify:CR=1 FL=1